jgi:hypothetical protein
MKYIRLNVIAEGHAEEDFVKDSLAKYLIDFGVVVQARRVMTSNDKRKTYRGGLMKYLRAKMDIEAWIKEEKGSDPVFFTTMFDYYALPSDFPQFQEAHQKSSPYEVVSALEASILKDIGHFRLIPYIQLHEFEALLLANPSNLLLEYSGAAKAVSKLEAVVGQFGGNPEMVNTGRETAPSKRIIDLIPEYSGNKVRVGAVLAGFDGIPYLKSRCRHFADWVDRLESLGLKQS